MQYYVGILSVWHVLRAYFDSTLFYPDVVTLQSNVLSVVKNEIAIHFQIIQDRGTDVQ